MDNMFGGGFSAKKLKPQLKMAVSRFQIASNKKSAQLKQQCREVAILLAEDPPKEEKARIRAEALIREDNLIEAYEILQLECELLAERCKLLEHSKDCPPDLISTVSDLLYAAPRVEIPELAAIRLQFRAKYGKEFEERALNNTGEILNERVVTKLSVQPPAAFLVQTYLEKICEQHEVDWKPRYRLTAAQMAEPMAAPVGYSVPVASGTGLGVTTGQEHIDEEYYKRHGGIPPPAPIPPPVVTATAYMPNNNNNNNPQQPTTTGFGEDDIYIPYAPSAPPSHAPGAGSNNRRGGGGHDDDDDNHTHATASTGLSSSYADLAAKFESLKK